jgi:hypothetical protein
MLIQIDGKTILELTSMDLAIFSDDMPADIVTDDLTRRLIWVITHKKEECIKALIANNSAITRKYDMVSSNTDILCQSILNDPDYKCRKMRDAEKEKEEKERKLISSQQNEIAERERQTSEATKIKAAVDEAVKIALQNAKQ